MGMQYSTVSRVEGRHNGSLHMAWDKNLFKVNYDSELRYGDVKYKKKIVTD
jgi:hypothetical protein